MKSKELLTEVRFLLLKKGVTNTTDSMSKKIKLELTQAQFEAIINITDDASVGLGCREDGMFIKKWVCLVDRMLKNNGYKRKYA